MKQEDLVVHQGEISSEFKLMKTPHGANYFFLYIFISLPLISFSNGGPVNVSFFRKTGNITLMQQAEIELLKENLNIKVVDDYTEIDVQYLLINHGQSMEVQYGFPVDGFSDPWNFYDGFPVFGEDNDPVFSFQQEVNNKNTPPVFWIVDSAYVGNGIQLGSNPPSSEKYTIIRKWYLSTIHFEKEKEVNIHVKYKIKNTLYDFLPGMNYLYEYSDRHFMYDLSPAGGWGNGTCGDLNIVLDLKDLESTGVQFLVSGLHFTKGDNSIYTYSANRFDLNSTNNIQIHYNNSHIKTSEFLQAHSVPNFVITSIISSNGNSNVANLLDGSISTTWKGKAGDWIELEIDTNAQDSIYHQPFLRGIMLLNGDYTNETHFHRSGKIKSLSILLDETINYNWEPWTSDDSKYILHLPEPEFPQKSTLDVNGFAQLIADERHLMHSIDKSGKQCKTSKIRIQILSSQTDNDKKISISEILLIGYYKK